MFSMVFIGAASAVVLLQADPEYVTVMSADGKLLVTGFAREGGITVTAANAEAGDEYAVTSGAVDHTLPLQLRFVTPSGPPSTGNEEWGVLWYDEDAMLWKWEESTTVDGYIVVRTMHLGRFAPYPRMTVDAPDFVSVYDALRDQAPDGAVGYRITVGAKTGDGPSIILADEGQHGGCNGAVAPGEETAYSAMTRTAHVLVNDVMTPVTFTFLAAWQVVDEGSCPEGQPFRAADEYATLPTSQ